MSIPTFCGAAAEPQDFRHADVELDSLARHTASRLRNVDGDVPRAASEIAAERWTDFGGRRHIVGEDLRSRQALERAAHEHIDSRDGVGPEELRLRQPGASLMAVAGASTYSRWPAVSAVPPNNISGRLATMSQLSVMGGRCQAALQHQAVVGRALRRRRPRANTCLIAEVFRVRDEVVGCNAEARRVEIEEA